MSSVSPSASAKKLRSPAARPPLAPVLLDVVLVVAFLALTFLLGAFPLKDTDFWWHLRTGDLIRQTGQVPHTDLYTFTVPDHPWIDLHWAYQVALSWGFARSGVVGLNLAKCAITCVAVLLLVTARRRDWPVWVMLLSWLPALLVLGGRMYVRPETLTLLYLAIDLAIFLHWDRHPALALLLPLVQVAWVNSQGLFVLGPILLSFALIDALLRSGSLSPGRRRWWRIVGLATFLTGLACLVNPYGLTGALYPLQLARTMNNPIFARSIAELTPIPLFIERSAGWHNLPLQLHLATMLLGALSFLIPLFWTVANRFRSAVGGAGAVAGAGTIADSEELQAKVPKARSKPSKRVKKRGKAVVEQAATGWRLSPLRLLLFVAFSVLSLQATRNSHQFAAVVGALTAWNFGEWAAAIRRRRRAAHPAAARRTPGAVSGVFPRLATLGGIAALFVLVASGRFYAMAGEGRLVGLGEHPLWFPHAAVTFAGQEGMPRRFLSFHDGYAALYEYHHGPGRKVFVDARLEVIGADLYERYMALRDWIQVDNPAWVRELDANERPAVLIGHADNAGLGATILAHPGWRCVWFDPLVAVYVHKSYTDVVAAHRVDLAARHFAPEPRTDPHGIPALLATAEALWKYASELQARGRADLARPLVLLGLDYGRRVRQADPEGLDGWKVLGKLESTREPPAMTETLHPERLQRYRLPFDPVYDLSTVRATYDLERALDVAPRDFMTLCLLIKLFEERGMDEAVEPLLDRLGRLVPINPSQAVMVRQAGPQGAQLRDRLGQTPAVSWENLDQLDRAVTAMLARGRARSAAEFLGRAYPDEPRPWEVADRLATLRLHLGEPARARALWEKANTPPRPAVRAARVAVTHLVEGDTDAARRQYHEALTTEPDLFEARYGLAVLEQDAGRASAALSEARQAVAHAPGDVARSAAQAIVTLVLPYAGEGDDAPRRLRREKREKEDETIRR